MRVRETQVRTYVCVRTCTYVCVYVCTCVNRPEARGIDSSMHEARTYVRHDMQPSVPMRS